MVDGLRVGKPNYDEMTAWYAEWIKQTGSWVQSRYGPWGAVQSVEFRHVDDTGPQPPGAKLLAERRQAVAVAVHRTDSPTIGMEELGPLAAHAAARARDEYRFHLARLDHIFDAVQRFGHITDVAAFAQKAT